MLPHYRNHRISHEVGLATESPSDDSTTIATLLPATSNLKIKRAIACDVCARGSPILHMTQWGTLSCPTCPLPPTSPRPVVFFGSEAGVASVWLRLRPMGHRDERWRAPLLRDPLLRAAYRCLHAANDQSALSAWQRATGVIAYGEWLFGGANAVTINSPADAPAILLDALDEGVLILFVD